MSSSLIIALDYNQQDQALALVDRLDPSLCALKIGSEMFTRFGPDFVKKLVEKQYRVFLDLKFHDIPNTVAKACKAAADLGVWMMNVHASGGLDMMVAAKKAIEDYKKDAPLLIAVTVLTSMSENQLSTIGINIPLHQHVQNLALLAEKAGLNGVVCSAQEAELIKKSCHSSFVTVTPGIRLPDSVGDDQSRTMTPQQAVSSGSDYLVIGRPITQAQDPMAVVLKIAEVLEGDLRMRANKSLG